jgi:hypothetical protein
MFPDWPEGWNRGLSIGWTVSPEKEVNQAMVAPPFPNPFASLSSLRRPPRREGSASAGAGAPARRPADAPRALTGGLGNPGPKVQSRDCPSLLLEGCSRRSSRFVVAGAARVAGVLLGKGSGSGPAGVRGGSGKALCLQGVSAAFRIRRSLGCGCGVVALDGIMLAVERAGLAQAGTAAQFGSRRDTGPPLCLGQGLAILPGGGAELRSPVTLGGGAGVSRLDVQVPPLLGTPHIPDPVAAAATLAAEVEALSPRAVIRAAAAPMARPLLVQPSGLWPGGSDWHVCFHERPRDTC